MSSTAWLVCIALTSFICFLAGWLWRGRKEDDEVRRWHDIYPSYSKGMFDPESKDQ